MRSGEDAYDYCVPLLLSVGMIRLDVNKEFD